MKSGHHKLLRVAELRSASAARALADAKARCEMAEDTLRIATAAHRKGIEDAAEAREDLRRSRVGRTLDHAALGRFLDRLKKTRQSEAELAAAMAEAEAAAATARSEYETVRQGFLKAHADAEKRAALAEAYFRQDARRRARREDLQTDDVPSGRGRQG